MSEPDDKRHSDWLNRLRELRLEREAAERTLTITLNRYIEDSDKRGAALDERIANLNILVDQFLNRDLNRRKHRGKAGSGEGETES